MEDYVKQGAILIATGVEALGCVIVAYAVFEATITIAVRIIRRQAMDEAKDLIRVRLGRWLSVALEFELAADIVRTAITPTWSDIGLLGAIIVIRTTLNFFLQREIAEIRKPE